LRDIGRALIDKFQWLCFKHEAEKLLIGFSFEDYGFFIKTIVQEYFVWWKIFEAFVLKNEAVVNVADVTNE
jgi:hypothetical protein